MSVDLTITIGNIITIIIGVVTVSVAAIGILRRVDRIEMKVDLMWKAFQLRVSNSK